MLSIFKKELASTLKSPLSYIVLAIFVGIINYLFLKSFFIEKILSMRGYFDLLVWFLIIFIPAISMKILSEEFKSGTIEFLLTKPVSLLNILFGKYLSLVVYFFLFIFSGLVLSFSVSFLGNIDGGIVFTNFLGLMLLASGMFAISFFASSITKNQIFAFLIAVFINFILVLIGLDMVQLSMPAFISNVLMQISLMYHFNNFLKGLVSLSDVFYFFTLVSGCIYFSYLSVFRFQKTGKIGISIFKGMEILLVSLIFIFVNLIVGKLNINADFTENNVYTISNASKEVLSNVKDVINVNFYVSGDLPPELRGKSQQAIDLMGQFSKYSSNNLLIKRIDPTEDKKEDEANSSGVYPIQIQTIDNDQYGVKKGYFGLVMQFGQEKETISYLGDTSNFEYLFISKILRLTSTEKKRIFLLTTDDIDKQVTNLLKEKIGKNYDIDLQKSSGSGDSLDYADNKIWIVLKGDKDFSNTIYNEIGENLDGDKTILLFWQAFGITKDGGLNATKTMSKIDDLLKDKFKIRTSAGVIGDLKNNSNISFRNGAITFNLPYNYFPKVFVNNILPISQGIDNVVIPFVASIDVSSANGYKVDDILKTSQFAFEDTDITNLSPEKQLQLTQNDIKEFSVGKVFSKDGFNFIAIPGIHMFDFVQGKDFENSTNFLSNLVDLYGGDKRLIEIRAKKISTPAFIVEDSVRNTIKIINIYVLPILFVLIGILISVVIGYKRKATY